MPIVQPNSLIVITGITGFIASHVALLVLGEGHRVRGTIRRESLHKAETIRNAFVEQGLDRSIVEKNLEFFPIESDDDLFSEDIWAHLFKDADAVEHIAFPIEAAFSRALIDKAKNATIAMLRIASETASIKRFVLTSTLVTAFIFPNYREAPITVQDWNDDAVRVVYDGEPAENYPSVEHSGPLTSYAASKVVIEKAAFDFVEKKKPHYDFVAVLPGFTLGPVLFGKPSLTPSVVTAALNGDTFFKDMILPQWSVDVRDVARIHYLGLVSEETAGKRLFAFAHPWGPNPMFALLRKHYPNARIPEDWEGGEADKQIWDVSASTALIGKWIPLETSILATAATTYEA